MSWSNIWMALVLFMLICNKTVQKPEGDTVSQGEIIAPSNNSGGSKWARLHYRICTQWKDLRQEIQS